MMAGDEGGREVAVLAEGIREVGRHTTRLTSATCAPELLRIRGGEQLSRSNRRPLPVYVACR